MESRTSPILVYKIGGSLLDLPDLPQRLDAVLRRRPDSRPLLVVGGGEAADLVRRWDRIHSLGEQRSHRLALRSMSLGESLVAELLSSARVVCGRREADIAWAEAAVPIICAAQFLFSEESRCQTPLPHTWEATSDSIAAWIAIAWPADELMLLKSVGRPPPRGPATITDGPPHRGPSPPVDACFRRFAARVPRVSWINLRSDSA